MHSSPYFYETDFCIFIIQLRTLKPTTMKSLAWDSQVKTGRVRAGTLAGWLLAQCTLSYTMAPLYFMLTFEFPQKHYGQPYKFTFCVIAYFQHWVVSPPAPIKSSVRTGRWSLKEFKPCSLCLALFENDFSLVVGFQVAHWTYNFLSSEMLSWGHVLYFNWSLHRWLASKWSTRCLFLCYSWSRLWCSSLFFQFAVLCWQPDFFSKPHLRGQNHGAGGNKWGFRICFLRYSEAN